MSPATSRNPHRPLPTMTLTRTKPHALTLSPYRSPHGLMLALVRHGEKGGPELDGLAGPSLTPLGKRQAKRLAARLADEPFDHIYSSDMARAYQTCKALREHHRGTPYTMLEDLREVGGFHHRGTPVARSREQRQRRDRDIAAVNRFIRRLRREHLKPGKAVLVVCHGNFIRLLLPTLAGLPPRRVLPVNTLNASLTIANLNPDGRVSLQLANCTRHLPTRMVSAV